MLQIVLVLEDHQDTREMVAIALRRAGYEVVTTATISGARELIHMRSFALYILDHHIFGGAEESGASGLSLCREIRSSDSTTPIIFVTAEAHRDAKEKALAAGGTAYLVKPVEIPELIETVRLLLGD